MRSNLVKISSQKTMPDIWDIENFTLLIQLFEMVWATIHKLCRKSSAGCLPMVALTRACWHGSQLFPFLFFSLAPYFTCNDADPVRIWSHVSRSCTAGIPLAGCLVLSWVTWVGQSYVACYETPGWLLYDKLYDILYDMLWKLQEKRCKSGFFSRPCHLKYRQPQTVWGWRLSPRPHSRLLAPAPVGPSWSFSRTF